MTLEDFQKNFNRKKQFDKFLYHGLCIILIGTSSFALFSLITGTTINFIGDKRFHIIALLLFILFGVYGLVVLRKKYKLYYWANHLTEDENKAILSSTITELLNTDTKITAKSSYFVYRRSWWRMPYGIHLYITNNLIAINVEGTDSYDGGFIDFGASMRIQKKILNILQEKASR